MCVHQKLTQGCKSTILQLFKNGKKKKTTYLKVSTLLVAVRIKCKTFNALQVI